jgi:hypothetical protein
MSCRTRAGEGKMGGGVRPAGALKRGLATDTGAHPAKVGGGRQSKALGPVKQHNPWFKLMRIISKLFQIQFKLVKTWFGSKGILTNSKNWNKIGAWRFWWEEQFFHINFFIFEVDCEWKFQGSSRV